MHIDSRTRKAAAALGTLALCTPLLAACGGSSASSTSPASASAGTATVTGTQTAPTGTQTAPAGTSTAPGSGKTNGSGGTKAGGNAGGSATGKGGAASKQAKETGAANGKSLSACLQKNGVTLKAGQKLPSGMTQAQYEAVLRKCLGSVPGKGLGSLHLPLPKRPTVPQLSPTTTAASKAALTRYATCMRENGVNLPPPNTSGNGPIFDLKGVDLTSTTFKKAEAKCLYALHVTYHIPSIKLHLPSVKTGA
jgi:hypothetical protein